MYDRSSGSTVLWIQEHEVLTAQKSSRNSAKTQSLFEVSRKYRCEVKIFCGMNPSLIDKRRFFIEGFFQDVWSDDWIA